MKLKRIKMLTAVPIDTNVDHQIYNPTMNPGSLVLRNGQILITETSTELKNMHDHKHPNLAAATHTHIQGANIPWLMANARLWYANDVSNHPELVVLNGQELSEEDAEKLSGVYYGNRLLTNPVTLNDTSFENDEITLTVTSFATFTTPDKLFGDEVTIENGFNFQDQWLSNNSDLDSEMTVTVAFKSPSVSYRPMTYYVIPASGTPTAEITKAPTPNTWYFEGKTSADSDWEIIDSHTGETAWQVLNANEYNVDTEKQFVAFRLRITKWNAGAENSGTLSTGLRRFWIFGRKNGYFSVPNIESPSDEFVWVVPKKDLNVGLKHEDIGDIGISAIKDSLLPNYRLPCDGSAKKLEAYTTLGNIIEGKYDHENDITYVNSSVTEENNTQSWAEYNLEKEEIISAYDFIIGNKKKPLSWVIKGYFNDAWVTLHTVSNQEGVDITSADSKTTIHADLTQVLNLPKCTKIRIEISAWSDTNEAAAGWDELHFYSHPEGYFYLPSLKDHYIVAENTAVDVSADIISKLQKNIVSLTKTVAVLQSQIQELKGE